MRTSLLVMFAAALAVAGCGEADRPADSTAESAAEVAPSGAQAAGGVPDPCALLTAEEAGSLGGQVQAGQEEESAWPNIRRCTWEGSGDGFYGVTVIVNTDGFESVRQMMMGDELTLEDLGMPAFFEMVGAGVIGIGVEQSGIAVHVQPIWTANPAPDSEQASTLKEVARSAAARL